MNKTVRPRHMAEYLAMLLCIAVVRALPQKSAIGLGRIAGRAASALMRSRVELAHRNLVLAFGDALSHTQRSRIIASLFSNVAGNFVEAAVSDGSDVEQCVTIEGMEYLEQALSRRKGVILLGPHMDAWELASYLISARVPDAATIYKPLKNPYVNRYLFSVRRKTSLGLIEDKNALRSVAGKLRKGRLVVMLFDQNAGRRGIPAKFFGETAFTYSAPAAFAMHTGCAVVPSYMVKAPGLRKHRMIVDTPFPLTATGDKQADILVNTQCYNDYFESVVRRYPDQWFGWLHNRWKVPRSRSAPSVPTCS